MKVKRRDSKPRGIRLGDLEFGELFRMGETPDAAQKIYMHVKLPDYFAMEPNYVLVIDIESGKGFLERTSATVVKMFATLIED